MSPLRRSLVTLIALLFVSLGGIQLAGAQPSNAIDRLVTISVNDAEPYVWDTKVVVANPGDKVTIRADMTPYDTPHNLHVKGVTPEPPATPLVGNQVHEVAFTMPAEGAVTYVCDAHPTMTGKVLTPAAAAAAGGGEEIDVPHLGVNFLSYWVGLISFMVLFVVYGATFFLFKYNETPATTDQWDRPGTPAGERRFSPGMASIIAVVIAAAVLGAVVYAAKVL